MKLEHIVNGYIVATLLSWLVGVICLFRHGYGRDNPHLHNAIMDWPMYAVTFPFWAPLAYVGVSAVIVVMWHALDGSIE